MSPASYLTAPPRVAGGIVATFRARQGAAGAPRYAVGVSLWLIALIVSGVVVVATSVHVVRRGLALYRAFRDSGAALGNGAMRVAEAAEQTAAKAERLGDDTGRVAEAAARLRRSQAQLNVLIQAIRDVQDSVTRLTALAPRK